QLRPRAGHEGRRPMTAITQKKRARGLGSTFLRGRMWWIKFHVNGQAVRESSESTKESDANKLLKRRLGEISIGRFAPQADKVTVGDLFTMLLADGRAKGNRSLPKLGHLCEAFDVAQKTDTGGVASYAGGCK